MGPSLALVLAMFAYAMPSLPARLRAVEAQAVVDAIVEEMTESYQAPTADLVVAIIQTESRGDPRACHNDRFGGSNRGVMQIRRPHTRCSWRPHDDLYDVRVNIRRGVAILAALARQEYVHRPMHDILDHYSGHRGPGPSSYTVRVRELASDLRAIRLPGQP